MICSFALIVLSVIISCLLSISGALPSVPTAVTDIVSFVFDLIYDGYTLASVFIDMDFLIVVVPIAILISQFERVIALVMFVLKKIPFLGIK